MKTAGEVDFLCKAREDAGYPWTIFRKEVLSTLNDSDIEEQKSLPDKRKDSNLNERIFECLDEKSLIKPNASIDGDESDDLIENFQDKPWMQQRNKDILYKPKSFSDSKLAIRSDVVNKTLLRSLKRYYTARFEQDTNYKTVGKFDTKQEIYEKLTEFTRSIYEGDRRFDVEEFSDVSFENLTFYMGI